MTRLEGVSPSSRVGVKSLLCPFAFGGFGAGLEAEAVVSGFQDVAVVRQPVEQRGRHLGVTEDIGPFGEAEIGGDGDAGPLVELAEQVEQQGSARGAERQVAELVEDDEVAAHQAFGDLARPAEQLLLLERVDEFDGGEEPNLLAQVLDGLDADR